MMTNVTQEQQQNVELICLSMRCEDSCLLAYSTQHKEIFDVRVEDKTIAEKLLLGSLLNCMTSKIYENTRTGGRHFTATRIKIIDEEKDAKDTGEAQRTVDVRDGKLLYIRSLVLTSPELFDREQMWAQSFGFLPYKQIWDAERDEPAPIYEGWVHFVQHNDKNKRYVLAENFIISDLKPLNETGCVANIEGLRCRMKEELEVEETRKEHEEVKKRETSKGGKNMGEEDEKLRAKQKGLMDDDRSNSSFGRSSFSSNSNRPGCSRHGYEGRNARGRLPLAPSPPFPVKSPVKGIESRKEIFEKLAKENPYFICLMLSIDDSRNSIGLRNVAWTKELGIIYVSNTVVRQTQRHIKIGQWFMGKVKIFKPAQIGGKRVMNEPVVESIMELHYEPYPVDISPNRDEIRITLPVTVIENETEGDRVNCGVLGYIRIPKEVMAQCYKERIIGIFVISKFDHHWNNWQLLNGNQNERIRVLHKEETFESFFSPRPDYTEDSLI